MLCEAVKRAVRAFINRMRIYIDDAKKTPQSRLSAFRQQMCGEAQRIGAQSSYILLIIPAWIEKSP